MREILEILSIFTSLSRVRGNSPNALQKIFDTQDFTIYIRTYVYISYWFSLESLFNDTK